MSTTATGATYAAARGRAYRFRVRARDPLGNVSPYITSEEVRVAAAETSPQPPSPPFDAITPTSARLRLASLERRGSRVSLRGRIELAARGVVTVEAKAARVRRRIRARIRDGRFSTSVRLPSRASGTITLRYAGDAWYLPQVVRVRFRRL
jgi:hypothetical protein